MSKEAEAIKKAIKSGPTPNAPWHNPENRKPISAPVFCRNCGQPLSNDELHECLETAEYWESY